jgi:undecaprenyl-diphosphatase
LYKLDLLATQAVNDLAGSSRALDFVMISISAVGVPLLVLIIALQWWRKPDRSHVRHAAVACGLSFLLGLALNQLILIFVHRMRPYDAGVTHLLIVKSSDPSFPSDHATASMAIASALLFQGLRRSGLWFLAAAILVMVSRIFVGTHYASDVLGGAVTGILAAGLVSATYAEGTRVDRLIPAYSNPLRVPDSPERGLVEGWRLPSQSLVRSEPDLVMSAPACSGLSKTYGPPLNCDQPWAGRANASRAPSSSR